MVPTGRLNSIASETQIWKSAREVFYLANIMGIFQSLTFLRKDADSLLTVPPPPSAYLWCPSSAIPAPVYRGRSGQHQGKRQNGPLSSSPP